MAPKKQNAYYFFMRDFKSQEEAKGVRFANGFKDVAVAASSSWKSLPIAARDKYEALARGSGSNAGEKYNTLGVSFSSIERKRREEDLAEQMENDEISDTIGKGDIHQNLLDITFFVMNTNIYCHVPNGPYVTSEFSLVAFSLKDGCSTAIHYVIDVGSIPMGYTREALKNCEETGIPLPPIAGAENDFVKILAKLLYHLGGSVNPAPIYTMPDVTRQVNSFLEQLCDSAGQDPSLFRLYSLPKLLFKLRNTLSKEEVTLPISMAQSVLERDVYLYVKGLACDLHEDGETFYKCSLSQATRWAYNICDHCCALAGVLLQPGKHVPLQSDPNGYKMVSTRSTVKAAPRPVQPTNYKIPEQPSENVMEEGVWPAIGTLKISGAPAWGPSPKAAAPALVPVASAPVRATEPRRLPYNDEITTGGSRPPLIAPAEWPLLSAAGRGAGRRRN